MRSRDERSTVRDWLLRGNNAPQRIETVYVGTGELPVGGPAANSTRQNISSANQALTRARASASRTGAQHGQRLTQRRKSGDAPA